jgi:hypothetical protein
LGNSAHGWRGWLPGVAMVSHTPSSRSSELWALIMERLYILEGIITVVWAFMCIVLVPKNYQTAYFLNDDDKAIMKHRAEIAESYSGGNGHYTMKDIKEAAKDPKSWGHAVIQIAVVTILYGEVNLTPHFYTLFNFQIQVSEPFCPSSSRMVSIIPQFRLNTS